MWEEYKRKISPTESGDSQSFQEQLLLYLMRLCSWSGPWSRCSLLSVMAEVRTQKERVTQQGGVACKFIFYYIFVVKDYYPLLSYIKTGC